jgi:bifunctional DNase/RNase
MEKEKISVKISLSFIKESFNFDLTSKNLKIKIKPSDTNKELILKMLAKEISPKNTMYGTYMDTLKRLNCKPIHIIIKKRDEKTLVSFLYSYHKNGERAVKINLSDAIIIALFWEIKVLVEKEIFVENKAKLFSEILESVNISRKHSHISTKNLRIILEAAIIEEDYEKAEEITEELKHRTNNIKNETS